MDSFLTCLTKTKTSLNSSTTSHEIFVKNPNAQISVTAQLIMLAMDTRVRHLSQLGTWQGMCCVAVAGRD